MTLQEAAGLLGTGTDADAVAIKAAYRQAAKRAHPDSPEGSTRKWDELLEARDLLMGVSKGQELVPISVAVELARTQDKALALREDHQDRITEADSTLHEIVRRQTSKLNERKRSAWALGVGAGGIALVVTLLRAVALVGLGGPENAGVVTGISILSVAAGVAAAVGWVLRIRAERIAHLIEDATTQLSSRGQYARVLGEIEREGYLQPPWTPDEFDQAIEEWALSVGSYEPRSMAVTALRVGCADFSRLVIVKGLELGLLTEETANDDGGIAITYRPSSARP
jgi:hypothetical protein